jgi:hypothetical protein
MGKKQVNESIKIFIERAKKNFNPQKIILFGSFAKGKTSEYSDVDLVILSDKFKNIPQEKRLDYLYDLIKDLYPDFHVFGFTSSEFENASRLTTIEEIKKYGKLIYST